MDYESHPDDNTDYAHATHWTIKWTCRCGKQHVTSSPGRYVTQTCKKCGVRWEIAPHLHDTTYHECVTEPITGAAEIESQPQDGRRIENRVSATEERVERLSHDNGFIRDAILAHTERYDAQIADLQQQVQVLTELMRVLNEEQIPQIIRNFDNHDQHFDVIYRKLGLGVAPDQRVSAAEANAEINTPPQPAADDAEKWEAVNQALWDASDDQAAGKYYNLKVVVAEAVKQGLVPRVDPDDAEQQQAVLDASLPPQDDDIVTAKRILTALAELNGGAS